MPITLKEAFPDEDNAITGSFFSSSEASDKTWTQIQILADSDDKTFWTVIAHHPALSSVLANLASAVENAHSTASAAQRRAVKKEDELNLVTLVVRLAASSDMCQKCNVDCVDMARRLGAILPLSVLFSFAVLLVRRSGAVACVCITSFMLMNPGYLCRFPAQLSLWYDQVSRLATRCVRELKRGRFQRTSGDIIQMYEQTYRGVKQIWAMLQSAPFLADYIPLSRTLRSLRIVVDVISPMLQHFLLLCESLASRRDVLSRANSMIINAALNASSVLVLLHTYNRAGADRTWVIPATAKSTYHALSDYMLQYAQGTAKLMMQHVRDGNISNLMHKLTPPLEEDNDNYIGKVLLPLFEEIADSGDFSVVFNQGTRQRYAELLLMELVQQGLLIDDLILNKFITSSDAHKLGASEDILLRFQAGEDVMVTRPAAAATSAADAEAALATAASVEMEAASNASQLVLGMKEMFPDYSISGIQAALSYYNNDAEQLAADLSEGNLPPHLVDLMTAPVQDPVSAAAVPEPASAGGAAFDIVPQSAAAFSLLRSDFEEQIEGEPNLQFFIGKDLYELLMNSSDDDDDAEEYHDYATYRKEDATEASYDAFNIGESMKDQIRMLSAALVYEDEYDDTAEDGTRMNIDKFGDTDDDGAQTGGAAPQGEAAAAEAGPEQSQQPHRRRAHNDYDEKRHQVQRAKDRAQFTTGRQKERAEAADASPAYTKKKKTSKESNRGGGKNAIARAYKKGRVDGF